MNIDPDDNLRMRVNPEHPGPALLTAAIYPLVFVLPLAILEKTDSFSLTDHPILHYLFVFYFLPQWLVALILCFTGPPGPERDYPIRIPSR